jgi:hypothetical protein
MCIVLSVPWSLHTVSIASFSNIQMYRISAHYIGNKRMQQYWSEMLFFVNQNNILTYLTSNLIIAFIHL